MEEELLVRLKPLNEKKGFRVKVYIFEGARFNVERGWYRVQADFGEKLRDLTQDHYDPDSPSLFDVCNEAQARKLEERERREAENERATVARPASVQRASMNTIRERVRDLTTREGGDLTTSDLRGEDEEPAMIDPADEDDDIESDPEDGRLTEVGRVTNVTSERRPSSKPGKVRTKK